jgi:hypothetical protein
LFKTQLADGIMGMDMKGESFWSQMFEAGKMGDSKQFSLCFSRQPTADRKGIEAGALTLGGSDVRFHASPMVFTSKASGGRSGFFSVKVRNIYLRDGQGGESVKSKRKDPTDGLYPLDVSYATMNTGGVIVDSGTTDTYWNQGIAAKFKAFFKDLTGKDYSDNAVFLTKEQMAALPTIIFQLESSADSNEGSDPDSTVGLAGSIDPDHPYDILIAFPPSHYMEYDIDTDKYTARFYISEKGGSVLGANAMMGHDVLFDIDNDRIGWAESDCDYTTLVTTQGYPNVLDDEDSGDGTGKGDEKTPAAKPSSKGTDWWGLIQSCKSNHCRGGVGLALAMTLVLLLCMCLCFCTTRSRTTADYRMATFDDDDEEVEMSSGNFRSYKDEPPASPSHDDDDHHHDDHDEGHDGEESPKKGEFEGDFI